MPVKSKRRAIAGSPTVLKAQEKNERVKHEDFGLQYLNLNAMQNK